MPEIKDAPRLRRRLMRQVSPGIAVILLTAWLESLLPASIRIPTVFIVLCLCGVAIIVAAVRTTRSFVCPDCGAAIAHCLPTRGVPGAPIRYHCTRCDVVWDTGLTTIDDN